MKRYWYGIFAIFGLIGAYVYGLLRYNAKFETEQWVGVDATGRKVTYEGTPEFIAHMKASYPDQQSQTEEE